MGKVLPSRVTILVEVSCSGDRCCHHDDHVDIPSPLFPCGSPLRPGEPMAPGTVLPKDAFGVSSGGPLERLCFSSVKDSKTSNAPCPSSFHDCGPDSRRRTATFLKPLVP